MNKLKSERGETLIEALVSLLIAVLAFSFLAMAAVSAGKINAKTRSTDVSFRYTSAQQAAGESEENKVTTSQPGKVTLTGEALTSEGNVTLFEYNDYHYYTCPTGTGGAAEVTTP